MKAYLKIPIFLHRLLLPVIFLLGASMCVVVLAQVFFRYVLSLPLPWSEELARYLMIWIACLAASEAYANGSHVGVNLIVDATPPGVRKIMILAIHLAVCILMGVIIFQGIVLSLALTDQISPAMGLPMVWPYLAVPTGAGLIFIQSAVLFLKLVQEPASAAKKCNAE